jgi:release factor glutamine methyltransferase
MNNGTSQEETADAYHLIDWSLTPWITVGRAMLSATQRLQEAGCDSASLDAQVLLAYTLGRDRSWLFAHHDHKISPEEADRYTNLVARRFNREPVAYLIRQREFYGHDFYVDRRVLIPRPETEMIVDLALKVLEEWGDRPVVVADVGTGSGAIAITLALHHPKATFYGLDISPDALDVARINQRRLAAEHELHFIESDLLSALPEKADLIVANLPYIAWDDYDALAPDIRHYEPKLALEAGLEGLDSIQRLLDQIGERLNPEGVVLLEIGADQGEAVRDLAQMMRPRPAHIGLRRDYSGHFRVVTLAW